MGEGRAGARLSATRLEERKKKERGSDRLAGPHPLLCLFKINRNKAHKPNRVALIAHSAGAVIGPSSTWRLRYLAGRQQAVRVCWHALFLPPSLSLSLSSLLGQVAIFLGDPCRAGPSTRARRGEGAGTAQESNLVEGGPPCQAPVLWVAPQGAARMADLLVPRIPHARRTYRMTSWDESGQGTEARADAWPPATRTLLFQPDPCSSNGETNVS